MFVAIFYEETETSYKVLSGGREDNFFAAIVKAIELVRLAYNDRLGPFCLHIGGFEINFGGE